jgi:hypothetical protein
MLQNIYNLSINKFDVKAVISISLRNTAVIALYLDTNALSKAIR